MSVAPACLKAMKETKGPAVCPHGTAYRQERLEGALLAKFREAMTAPTIEALASMVNTQLEAVFQGHNARKKQRTNDGRIYCCLTAPALASTSASARYTTRRVP